METRKLKGHTYMQAHIDSTSDGNVETLVSYDAEVLVKVKNFQGTGRTAYRLNGLYSRNTIRHISLYLREQNVSYYHLKPCANTEWLMLLPKENSVGPITYYNQNTGEIIIGIYDDGTPNLPNKFFTTFNLDGEKYSDMIYYDGTDMKGYYRW